MSAYTDPYARTEEATHVTPSTEFDDDRKMRIKAELDKVLDPCSCMSDHPISILDLGLVESISVDDRDVEITLLLTSQRCTYFLDINDEVCQRVEALEEFNSCEVHQDTSGQIWTNDRMSTEQREVRRKRFHKQMDAAGVTPYVERSE
jgi:metal-sulfur cluster biosynthetic enzyme